MPVNGFASIADVLVGLPFGAGDLPHSLDTEGFCVFLKEPTRSKRVIPIGQTTNQTKQETTTQENL